MTRMMVVVVGGGWNRGTGSAERGLGGEGGGSVDVIGSGSDDGGTCFTKKGKKKRQNHTVADG